MTTLTKTSALALAAVASATVLSAAPSDAATFRPRQCFTPHELNKVESGQARHQVEKTAAVRGAGEFLDLHDQFVYAVAYPACGRTGVKAVVFYSNSSQDRDAVFGSPVFAPF